MINKWAFISNLIKYAIALAVVQTTTEILKAQGAPVWLGVIICIIQAIAFALIFQLLDRVYDIIKEKIMLKKVSKEDLHIHAVIPDPRETDGQLQLLCALSMTTKYGDPEEYLELIEKMNSKTEEDDNHGEDN